MAELSKISGVAIADVAAVDAVLKANIASILGLTLPSGAAFLLDTYTGAAAGYSVRRIASGATNLMRIREDSGDTETDIGYDANGDLDTAAIATHCGSANGYVVTWYDQAGSNNATQSTLASQPQIYDGTAVITENGKPALDFDGAQQLTALSGTYSQPYTVFSTANASSVGSIPYIYSARTVAYVGHAINSSTSDRIYAGTSLTSSAFTESQMLFTDLYDGSSSIMRHNGSQSITGNAGTNSLVDFVVGQLFNLGNTFSTGKYQEFVVYGSDQTSNFIGIETNINSEYLIYQPTDTPTSGLLATYSGAAAAYSVRQLADTAVISMTVRRDSDDEEKRFGFDENGDLDTAGIASFCGSANGYVSQWWDQSTNGNHASQGTAASQPQIYNGTTQAVITDNGKPAVDFAADYLSTTTSATLSNGAFFAACVFSVDSSTSLNMILGADAVGVARVAQFLRNYNGTLTSIGFTSGGGPNTSNVSGTAATTQYLGIAQADGVNLQVFRTDSTGTDNGNITAHVNTTTATQLAVGAQEFDGTNPFTGNIQEVILWPSNQSTSRTNISSDITTYFSI